MRRRRSFGSQPFRMGEEFLDDLGRRLGVIAGAADALAGQGAQVDRHLGHLHHELTDAHYAEIGRLDILMVPVDGGLTLSHTGMAEITARLRSSIVLPMHLRGTRLERFLSMMSQEFAIEYLDGDSITVTVRDLPKRPTIMVPSNLSFRG